MNDARSRSALSIVPPNNDLVFNGEAGAGTERKIGDGRNVPKTAQEKKTLRLPSLMRASKTLEAAAQSSSRVSESSGHATESSCQRSEQAIQQIHYITNAAHDSAHAAH